MAFSTLTNGRVLSIDVECVATSFTHEDRSPCSVAIVNDQCQIIFSSLIKPAEKVVSDLYIFTGLRLKDLEQAPSLEEVLQQIYPLLDSTTIIIGQSPKNDVKWLKLEKGVHYSSTIDLSEWFKTYNPRFGSMNFFSLAHEAWILLNIDLNAQKGHLATQDAKAAMQLYLKYQLFKKKEKKQNMKTVIFLAIFALLFVVSTSNAKRLFYDNDNDMELTDKKARTFLRSMADDDDDDAASFDTREIGKNCVKCKFGINPCCAPNICVKKRFRPDECMEIKQGK